MSPAERKDYQERTSTLAILDRFNSSPELRLSLPPALSTSCAVIVAVNPERDLHAAQTTLTTVKK